MAHMSPTGAARWELSPNELDAAYAVEREWSARTLASLLAKAPALIPEALLLAARAAARGVVGDVELAVLLDSERVRQALPGTIRGAAWSPVHTFLDALHPVLEPGGTVLEIGCGVGRVARTVAPQVKELLCTDVSRVMVREARTNLASFDNVRVQRTSGFWLEGVARHRFDLVYSHAVFVFFDLYPAIAMLDAVRRVLRPGGTSVIGFLTMDRAEWKAEAVEIARRSARRGAFGARSVRPYTQAQVLAMHQAAGLEVAHCGYGATTESDHHPPLIVTATAGSPRPVTE